jgi:hypothetical protein
VVTALGELNALPIGPHTLTVFASSGGVSATASVAFTITAAVPPPPAPPTVEIVAPTVASFVAPATFTLTSKGTSTAPGGITLLTASVAPVVDDVVGTALTLAVAPYYYDAAAHAISEYSQPVVYGDSVVALPAPGTYLLTVTAQDAFATSTPATKTITVTSPGTITIRGTVFADVNFNGTRQTADEPGVGGITVKLTHAGVTSTQTTESDGTYAFTVTAGAGACTIDIVPPTGLNATSVATVHQVVTADITNITTADCGLGLNWAQIRALTSTALSQGFWKNNVGKAISGKGGTQVSAPVLRTYTTAITTLALSPFSNVTRLEDAAAIFSGKNQLSLQLLAAEYNYEAGSYIGGSEPLTRAFITWGEAVMKNTGNVYNSAYQTFAAKWFEAYDTSEGGKVLGPLP